MKKAKMYKSMTIMMTIMSIILAILNIAYAYINLSAILIVCRIMSLIILSSLAILVFTFYTSYDEVVKELSNIF